MTTLINQIESAYKAGMPDCPGPDLSDLCKAFFSTNPMDWRWDAQIITGWVPQLHEPEWHCYGKEPHNEPKCVVKYNKSFLRYSQGPRQGFGWDTYGDDMMNWGLAFKALVEAPAPPCLWVARSREFFPESLEKALKFRLL